MRWLLRGVAIGLLLSAMPVLAGDYYDHGSFPSPGSPATSASMRAELDLIAAGFAKFPAFSGNANKPLVLNGTATGYTFTTGTLALAGNLATTGAFNTTLVQSATTTITLPGASGTLATLAGTETLSNKTLSTLLVSGTGPHAIGGALDPAVQLKLSGTFTGTSIAYALRITGTFTSTSNDAGGIVVDTATFNPAANTSAYAAWFGPTINKANSGIHPDFTSLILVAPTIGVGSATVTNASTLKIANAPTGATNNYALWVDSGYTRLDGPIELTTGTANLAFDTIGTTGGGGGLIDSTGAGGLLRYWSPQSGGAHAWLNNIGTQHMALTDGGILTLGTTVTTGATGGDLAIKHTGALRFINQAGTTSDAYGIKSETGNNLEYHVPSNINIHKFVFANVTRGFLAEENGGMRLEFSNESSADHGAAQLNGARVYIKDNGAGKTQLAVRFNTGAAQILATEP